MLLTATRSMLCARLRAGVDEPFWAAATALRGPPLVLPNCAAAPFFLTRDLLCLFEAPTDAEVRPDDDSSSLLSLLGLGPAASEDCLTLLKVFLGPCTAPLLHAKRDGQYAPQAPTVQAARSSLGLGPGGWRRSCSAGTISAGQHCLLSCRGALHLSQPKTCLVGYRHRRLDRSPSSKKRCVVSSALRNDRFVSASCVFSRRFALVSSLTLISACSRSLR